MPTSAVQQPAPPLGTIPKGTPEQLEEARRLLRSAPREPLLPAGTVTSCQFCGRETMVTTNNLQIAIPTPSGVRIVTRLPGAECVTCGTKHLDAGAAAILEEHRANEIVADYETTVTTIGPMLATYLKGDLRRIFGLKGKERLRWKIIDRSHAVVEVER